MPNAKLLYGILDWKYSNWQLAADKFYCVWNIKRHGLKIIYGCFVKQTNRGMDKNQLLGLGRRERKKHNQRQQQQRPQQLDLFMIIGLNYTNFPVFGNFNVQFVCYFRISLRISNHE